MTILAFTDIHGAYDTVSATLERESQVDGIIIGGDLTTHGSVDDVRNAIMRFQKSGKPIFAVAGNMDPRDADRSLDQLSVSVNSKGIIFGEMGVFGVSGSPPTPMHTPYEISEEEIAQRAEQGWKDVAAARWKIFVPHAPPNNTRLDKIVIGKHVGSTAVRSFIDRRQPDVVICGHIHEARGIDTLGKTQMVNCGQAGKGYYAVITLDQAVQLEVRG